MRILFFWLNVGAPAGMNIGVSILSTELKQAGHNTKIVHLHDAFTPFDLSQVRDQVASFVPDIVGVSFRSNQAQFARTLLALLGREFPDLPTLCGGPHPTVCPEEVINMEGGRIVCRGEAREELGR